MKRKVVSCVLVSSLLFSIGCYSTRTVTKEELKARNEQVDITVWTKDSLEYRFSKKHYRIQGDTLTGFGVQVRSNTSPRDSVVIFIALADVTSLKTEELDLGGTIIVIGLPVGLVVVLLIAITTGK